MLHKGDAYQGINSVFSFECTDGTDDEVAANMGAARVDKLYFELQFHTPASITTKEETCHVSYEQPCAQQYVGKSQSCMVTVTRPFARRRTRRR